jgi:preprotein translocase subunit SecF
MLRFDLRFAPGGIVALAHDAALTIGAFALTWKEFNLQTIAALLTIIGYSINDTIVVFDRIRERVTLYRGEDINETANVALNETLSRTILTSGTTLLVVIATWVLGTGPIKDFAFALFIGITVGTYSSLFIATPVFLWVNRRFYGGLLAPEGEAPATGTGTLLGAGSNMEIGADGQIIGGDIAALEAQAAKLRAEKLVDPDAGPASAGAASAGAPSPRAATTRAARARPAVGAAVSGRRRSPRVVDGRF